MHTKSDMFLCSVNQMFLGQILSWDLAEQAWNGLYSPAIVHCGDDSPGPRLLDRGSATVELSCWLLGLPCGPEVCIAIPIPLDCGQLKIVGAFYKKLPDWRVLGQCKIITSGIYNVDTDCVGVWRLLPLINIYGSTLSWLCCGMLPVHQPAWRHSCSRVPPWLEVQPGTSFLMISRLLRHLELPFLNILPCVTPGTTKRYSALFWKQHCRVDLLDLSNSERSVSICWSSPRTAGIRIEAELTSLLPPLANLPKPPIHSLL